MFTPQNEQGVVVAFAQAAAENGWQIVEIGAAFPDALLSKDGEVWRTEFEFRASNFLEHKHDHRGCDLIICWENNYTDSPIPVLALSDDGWKSQSIKKPDPNALAAEYWMRRAYRAESNKGQQASSPANAAPVIVSTHVGADRRRQSVLDYYKANPGASYQTAATALGIGKTTVHNVVRFWERAGSIRMIGNRVEVVRGLN